MAQVIIVIMYDVSQLCVWSYLTVLPHLIVYQVSREEEEKKENLF